eukprot:g67912.t1
MDPSEEEETLEILEETWFIKWSLEKAIRMGKKPTKVECIGLVFMTKYGPEVGQGKDWCCWSCAGRLSSDLHSSRARVAVPLPAHDHLGRPRP